MQMGRLATDWLYLGRMAFCYGKSVTGEEVVAGDPRELLSGGTCVHREALVVHMREGLVVDFNLTRERIWEERSGKSRMARAPTVTGVAHARIITPTRALRRLRRNHASFQQGRLPVDLVTRRRGWDVCMYFTRVFAAFMTISGAYPLTADVVGRRE